MKGTLDRIEDGHLAVILLEEAEQEIILPIRHLPEGSRVNSWFEIELNGEEIVSIALDEETAEAKENEAQELMQKLRSRRRGSRFKRE
ncbi:hypothetical protein AC739_06875 [Planococcus glaciei]|uniref:DUF3006 domain-containing protein n=1 Tax=Planococcus glaciei TaxID=459472 RepID=A0A7H8QAQ7_9BACL|nr:DUF3006 domain-containing protein [Planococcus glaciei]KOF11104.1 hypothetical protein AC739_06875 [Planococcus glaciei]MBX0315636.1 DUF3006 domain-containing protein [Planococcus glaciei]QDY45530.1 DUF3006 domain-containing protein [Planococcus glaciei]QKX50652.1 DUF3006 domain-containing protein [Planococcus glaciei]